MKKNILKLSALCAAAVMMSSCVRAPIEPYDYTQSGIKTTLADVVAVNNIATALSNHENCYVTCNLKGEEYWGFGTYQDDEMYFREYFGISGETFQSTIWYGGDRWFMRYAEDGTPVLSQDWLAMGDAEKREKYFIPGRTELFYNRDNWQTQTVTDIREDVDGKNTFNIYTRNPDSEVQAVTDRYNLHNTKYWFATLEHEYTLNKDTLEIEYDYNYIRLHNGKKYIFYTTLVQYDVLPPDYMKMVTASIEMAVNSEEAETKTVTIVYDDGQEYSIQYNGLYTVIPYVSEGYSLYTDPAGSNKFEGEIPYEEITLYCLKK